MTKPPEDTLGQRAPLWRELIDGRTNVRSKLPRGEGRITGLSYLRERLTVMIEKRERNDLAGSRGANSRRRVKPPCALGKRPDCRYRDHRGCFEHRTVLPGRFIFHLGPHGADRLSRWKARRL